MVSAYVCNVSRPPFSGNEKTFMDAFCARKDSVPGAGDAKKAKVTDIVKPLEKTITRIHIMYDEASLVDRKEIVRGVATIDQTETVFLVSRMALQVDRKARVKYHGTTAGSLLGPVAAPAFENIWQETVQDKKAIWGSSRVAVGGRTEGYGVSVGSPAKGGPKDPNALEPVCFHSKPEDLYEELVHTLGGSKVVRRIIDLTVGDGPLAHLAIRKRMTYLGFAATEVHAGKLGRHLQAKVYADFKTEGHDLYRSALASLLETIGEEAETEEPNNDPDPANKRPKAKGKARGKAKAKAKGKKATAEALKGGGGKDGKDGQDGKDGEDEGEGEDDGDGESEGADSMSGKEE